VSADEHVPEIERRIGTVKERTRCIYDMLPFQQILPRMLIEMVYSSNFWLNSFPPDDHGVSPVLSPRAIVAGMELNYAKHCHHQLKFGTYVQTHEEHDNSMATCTTGAIALQPTGNNKGGYYFYNLTTGQRINRNRWTSLPMPNDVIDPVRNLAHKARANIGLLFTDRNGHPLTNADDDNASDSDDDTYNPDDDSTNGDDDDYNSNADDISIAGVNDEISMTKISNITSKMKSKISGKSRMTRILKTDILKTLKFRTTITKTSLTEMTMPKYNK
jgi:hypothetical protein